MEKPGLKVSIHQPAFNPWLGYLAKIRWSDVFVFLDTVQFEKNSFTNRNKIKTADKEPMWLTIPVLQKNHTTGTLQTLEIDHTQNWKKKHLRALELNYGKAPHFQEVYPKIKELYEQDHKLLSDFCFNFLTYLLDYFSIKTKVIRTSDRNFTGQKSDLVLNICKNLEASEYMSGALGRDYLKAEDFAVAGIKLHFQEYIHPTYSQLNGPFVSHLGVIDYLMNAGRIFPESPRK